VDEAALLADLAAIRARGYSIDEGEQEVGVRCFAIAVPGPASMTAVSVSGPDSRITLESADWIVPALNETAQSLREAFGAGGDAA